MREKDCYPGLKVGRLTLLCRDTIHVPSGNFNGWKCKCDCGNVKTIVTSSIGRKTLSCGCLAKEKATERLSKNPENFSDRYYKSKWYNLYLKWSGMIARCEDPKNRDYPMWGGRGIKVCDAWHSYENFKDWAISNGYNPAVNGQYQSTDRIDVNGGYSPDNCRLTDARVQANNRRSNVRVYKDGAEYTVEQVASIAGVAYETILSRKRLGWSDEELFLPKQQHFDK